MKLAYIFDGKTCVVNAEITTDHPASSYGLPVIVLADGGTVSAYDWVLLNYRPVELTADELPLLNRWLDNAGAVLNMDGGGDGR